LSRHILRIFAIACSLCAAGGAVSAQTTVRVTVEGASIWSAPSTPSIVMATVTVGTMLQVVNQEGSWYRVRLPNDPARVGFILVRQVEGGPAGDRIPPMSPQSAARSAAVRRRGPPRRAFASIGGGYQAETLHFENTVSFTEFVEQGSRKLTYSTQRRPLFDVGGGVEIVPGLFIAAAASRYTGFSDVAIDEQIPHPLFFGQMRTLTAEAKDLPRDETALHIQAAGLVRVNKRMHMVLAAGPSLFKLKQGLVTDVKYNQEYPYDVVTFQGIVSAVQEKTAAGFNAQLNVVTMVGRHVGVDGFARFSHATMTFTDAKSVAFTAPAGGLQLGVGLRAEF
jgi:hypothetical protein